MIKIIGNLMIAFSITSSLCVAGAEMYEYDMLNRLTKVTYEDGSYVEYEYDANGNITDTYVYDATPEEDEEGKDESDDNESSSSENEEENNAEDGSDIPENEDAIEDEPDILTSIVSAIQNIVTQIVNWFKRWF